MDLQHDGGTLGTADTLRGTTAFFPTHNSYRNSPFFANKNATLRLRKLLCCLQECVQPAHAYEPKYNVGVANRQQLPTMLRAGAKFESDEEMPRTSSKLCEYVVLETIGGGSFGTCRKVSRKQDGKVPDSYTCSTNWMNQCMFIQVHEDTCSTALGTFPLSLAGIRVEGGGL